MELSSSQQISILPLLWKKRNQLLLITIIGMVILIVYSLIAPHTYRSSTKVITNDSKSGGLGALMTGLPAYLSAGTSASIPVLTVNEVLNSRTNMEYVIKKCKLDSISPFNKAYGDEKFELMSKILSSDAKRASGVITLECTLNTQFFSNSKEQQETARLASEICNAAIEGLDKINREKNVSTARRTRLYIERVLASNHRKLDSVQTKLVEYQKTNKVLVADEQAKSLVASTVELGTLLAKAELELKLAQQEYQPQTALVSTLEKRVSVLRQQFEDAQNGGIDKVDQLSIPVSQAPAITKGYLNFVRDIKIMEQMNAYLESQRMQEAIQEERDLPTIQVVDPAIPPTKRIAPARSLMVMIGSIVSLFGSIVIIILIEILKNWWAVKKQDFKDLQST